MTNDTSPPLALSDIIHVSSPSPAPSQTDTPAQTRHTPDPVSDTERTTMLRRLAELGLSGKENANITERERELVDMVIRLTTESQPDHSQLVLQATTISDLMFYQNFLTQRAEEDRSRWESEKDGWLRIAKALTAQRNKAGNSTVKDEELERQCATFESHNGSLRDKLKDTQLRLTTLESELKKLRPLLLMQPPSPSSTHNLTTDARHKPNRTRKPKDRGKGKGKDPASPNPFLLSVPEEQDTGDDVEELADDSLTNTHPNNTTHHRHSSRKLPRSAKSNAGKPHVPLLSDARSEHLLLAARKIGRERAEIMAGLYKSETREERERKREEMAPQNTNTNADSSSPKTPKRAPAQIPLVHLPVTAVPMHVPIPLHPLPTGSAPPYAQTSNGSFVFVNSPIPFNGSPMHPPYILPYPPVQVQTPTRSREGVGGRVNPPTPLDSLLSAARSLMDDPGGAENDRGVRGPARVMTTEGETGSGSGIGKPRLASALDAPDSPVPHKRRKVAGGSTASTTRQETEVEGDSSKGVGRVKSALDVLADQAAAFSSKEHELEKNGGGDSKTRRKSDELGRAKAKTRKNIVRGKSVKGKDREERGRYINGDEKEEDKDKKQGVVFPMSSLSYQFSGKWGLTPPSLRPVSRWGVAGNSSPAAESPVGVQGENTEVRETTDRDNSAQASSSVLTSSQWTPRSPLASHGNVVSGAGLGTVDSEANGPRRRVYSMTSASSPPIMQPRSRSEDPRRLSRSPTSWREESPTPRRAASIPCLSSPSPSRWRLRDGDTDVVRGDVEGDRPDTGVGVGDAAESELEAGGNGSGSEGGGVCSEGNTENVSVGEQMVMREMRRRSPYVKWGKDEDDLLAQAVAKYGQKWDLVQKALPNRGYHQVRQRWLRRLGAFDNKPDLSSIQTGILPSRSGSANSVSASKAVSGTASGDVEDVAVDPPPNPKLGLAPLSSERAFVELGSER